MECGEGHAGQGGTAGDVEAAFEQYLLPEF